MSALAGTENGSTVEAVATDLTRSGQARPVWEILAWGLVTFVTIAVLIGVVIYLGLPSKAAQFVTGSFKAERSADYSGDTSPGVAPVRSSRGQ
jgi:ABC-type Fe3+ transport system permease subunit